jgi:LmbE family N-acetylglucosaminyl deacetylase/molybdopterin-guanine dinucleotide biosynthesis protein A
MSFIDTVSVVIPARDEAATILDVVAAVRGSRRVGEVVVVDNGSSDDTARLAERAGARVVACPQPGFGRAMKAGLKAAKHRWIFKCDADMRTAQADWVDRLVAAADAETWLVKGNWTSDHDPMPVTQLTVRPALKRMYPKLLDVEVPLSGVYLLDRDRFEVAKLSDTYALDLELVLQVRERGGKLLQVDIGDMQHADRGLAHDAGIATEIMAHMIDRFSADPQERLLVVMAHADDPVIWAGGLIGRYAAVGAQVHVVVACADETRKAEALSIQSALPEVDVTVLDQPEFIDLVHSPAFDGVNRVIGAMSPTLIVTHHEADPHPDHRACCETVCAALMALGSPAFPRLLLMCAPYFFETRSAAGFRPTVYVDVSNQIALKQQLLAEHRSQDIVYWRRLFELMDGLSGLKAGVDRAEAFEPMPYYRTPRARGGV